MSDTSITAIYHDISLTALYIKFSGTVPVKFSLQYHKLKLKLYVKEDVQAGYSDFL